MSRRGIFTKVGNIPAGFQEILVAGRALLAIPTWLVDEDDGGHQAESLDGEGDMRQIGDRAMTVLKIKGVEELFRALGTDIGERLAHGERRARVFCHGKGQNFRICAMNGKDLRLVLRALGE